MGASLARGIFAFAWTVSTAAGVALAAPPEEIPLQAPKAEPIVLKIDESKPALKDVTPPELEGHHEPFAAEAQEHEEVPHGFYGAADYLFLRPRQRGLEYALVDPANDLVPRGEQRSVRYDFRSGLHVVGGYRLKDSGWDLAFGYTYLNSQGDNYATAPAGGLIYPQLTRPGLVDNATNAMAHARLNYNLYDIETGKLIRIDNCSTLRVFGGIRFAQIQQQLDARYNGLLADFDFVRSRSNFYGAGPMVGGEMRWKVFKGLSVFGRAEGGLIMGRTSSTLTETNNSGATLYSDIDNRDRSVVPMIGLSIGGSYQFRGFTLSAGYQAVNWFGLVQRRTLYDDFAEGKSFTQGEDLSLDGFFIRLGMQF